MHYVVGSGPSGVACARALVDRGLPVTMLDAGIDLERDREVHRATLARTTPAAWPAASVAAVKAGMMASPSGVPVKRVFGSDFTFREPDGAIPLRQTNAHALRSFARGGLSRAWGATLLPMAAQDVAGWPVTLEDLAPHYRAVMTWLPLAAASDDLDEFFPMYTDAPGNLRPSRQAADILDRLAGHRAQLRRLGVTMGRARLAVRATPDESGSGCCYCRLCLYGCPYGCIFTADQALTGLIARPGFTYRPGVVVTRVRERPDAVQIDAHDLAGGAGVSFSGDHVFLGCGVLTTSQLLMDVLAVDEVRIRTSQSFLMPLVKHRADKSIRHDDAHALTQIYLIIDNAAVAKRLVQLQIYTHSDLMTAALEHSFAGAAFRGIAWLRHAAENRIVVMQGLLSSDDSDDLSMTKRGGEFELSGSLSPATRTTVRRVATATRAIGALGGFRPLTPLLQMSEPGQSFHSGASFPMARAGGRTASDLLGRPGGLSRIHAIDATVLPDIPAPPLTLTVMANAHRIGTLA